MNENLDSELAEVILNTRSKLLSNITINFLLRILKLRDTPGRVLLASSFFSAVLLLGIFFLSPQLYLNKPLSYVASILAVLLIFFSHAIVKILHDIILPPNVEKIIDLLNDNGKIALKSWFQRYLSIPKQLIFSLVFSILCVITLYFVEVNTSSDYVITDYILGFLAIFSISHGGYSALLIPTIARDVSKAGVELFWMDPANSPIIKIANWGYSLLSLADAIFVSLCILTIYWLNPWESVMVATISALWLVAGLIAVMYSFLFPHYYLNKAIQSEKELHMFELFIKIETYRDRIGKLSGKDFEKLREYQKLYDRLSNVRETAIDTSSLRSFISSLAIPILSFISGLVDFGEILAKII